MVWHDAVGDKAYDLFFILLQQSQRLEFLLVSFKERISNSVFIKIIILGDSEKSLNHIVIMENIKMGNAFVTDMINPLLYKQTSFHIPNYGVIIRVVQGIISRKIIFFIVGETRMG